MKDPLHRHSDREMKIFKYFYYLFLFIGLPIALLAGLMVIISGDLNFSKFTFWDYLGFIGAGAFPLTLAYSRWHETKDNERKKNDRMANLNKSNIRKTKK